MPPVAKNRIAQIAQAVGATPASSVGGEGIDYDAVLEKYAAFKAARTRSDGNEQYTSDLDEIRDGSYGTDPWAAASPAEDERAPLEDEVEVVIIGGGFSALLTSAELRAQGVKSIRVIERGSDFGGTWYWNRYPGVACDVCAYDYLPLLDELEFVPSRYFAQGPEILGHCQKIADHFNLYELAVFRTTVETTTWDESERVWHVGTNRGDDIKAKFVICANGTLSKPKLPKAMVDGLQVFKGESFHSSRWDYGITGENLEKLAGLRVGFVGTGATGVQAIPELAGAGCEQLYVFQRTPSSVDKRNDFETDPEWAANRPKGYFSGRRDKMLDVAGKRAGFMPAVEGGETMTPEEKVRKAQEGNIKAMMRIHSQIDEQIEDPATAEALKPQYMIGCKRPTSHAGFLPVFNQPNVSLVDTQGKGIDAINEGGILSGGVQYDLDVLIMATGFEVQQTGIWNVITGIDGLELQDKYSTGIRTLLGISSRGFPNLFIMGGYQAAFSFNLVDILKTQGDHIAKVVSACNAHGDGVVDVKADSEEWWVQQVIANRAKSSYAADCTPGYYNFEGQEQRPQDGNFNGGVIKYYDSVNAVGDALGDHFEFI